MQKLVKGSIRNGLAIAMLSIASFAHACAGGSFIGGYSSGDGLVETYECPNGGYLDFVCADAGGCEAFYY